MLFLLSLLCLSGAPDELTKTVQLYWDALLVSDKVSAMRFVHPEDLNNFINRREARFKSWKLLNTEIKSENEAEVRIQLERILSTGVVGTVSGKETWFKTEGGWKLRVKPADEQYRELFAGTAVKPEESKPPPMAEELVVTPETLSFYAAFPRQPRILHIRNGLEVPAEVTEIQFDTERFQLLESPERVEPRSSALVKLQYTGSDEGENLQSEFLLRLKQEGQSREFKVHVVYNYMDKISRWLKNQRPKKPKP